METIITSLIAGLSVAIPTLVKLHYDNKNNDIDAKLDTIRDELKEVDKNQCKNYLILYLARVENMEIMKPTEHEHAHYVYDHYVNDLKGNSYIKDYWERVIK